MIMMHASFEEQEKLRTGPKAAFLTGQHFCWVRRVERTTCSDGVCYKALGLSPGFAPDAQVSAYLQLLLMLGSIGSQAPYKRCSHCLLPLKSQSHPYRRDITGAFLLFIICC
ncbi:hypothetical protein ABBQ38_009277 [Trebouxia sp. C0009 RCD-2024]